MSALGFKTRILPVIVLEDAALAVPMAEVKYPEGRSNVVVVTAAAGGDPTLTVPAPEKYVSFWLATGADEVLDP